MTRARNQGHVCSASDEDNGRLLALSFVEASDDADCDGFVNPVKHLPAFCRDLNNRGSVRIGVDVMKRAAQKSSSAPSVNPPKAEMTQTCLIGSLWMGLETTRSIMSA